MAQAGPQGRRLLLLAFGFCLVAAVFRFPRLGVPREEVFDEVYHAKTALEYLHGLPPTEWVHPPTAKLLIAAGVKAFGYHSWAWRLAPAIAGTLLAPVFFLLGRRVLPTERAAILATVLLLADGVYLVQSRIAMTNIFAVLFQVAAALAVLSAAVPLRLSAGWMIAAGAALGLALSTRWTSLFAWGFLLLVFAGLRQRRLACAREALLGALAFVVLPLALYLVSYLPWMLQGHTLAETVGLQRAIWRYHADLKADHPYFSHWYTWPWLYRPTWYHFKADGIVVRGILAVGNPALWWASVPAAALALLSCRRRVNPPLLFAGAGFFALYLPWGLSPRTLNFSHYLFEAIPYACLCLGLFLDRHWTGPAGPLARGYLVLAILLFVMLFPMLTAYPVPQWMFFDGIHGARPWTWFPTWI
jgi:dolichyl-phosphate-mannose-protein mannosyltransferase